MDELNTGDRVALINTTLHSLARLLTGQVKLVDVPSDLEIIDIVHEQHRLERDMSVYLKCRSSEFGLVPYGGQIPIMEWRARVI